MKKLILFGLIVCTCTGVFAQVKKPAKPAAKPSTPVLKNVVDSFSYAIGLSIASFYKAQGVKEFNNDLVLQALKDAQNGKELMNESEVNNCIVTYMQVARSEKANGNKKAGEAFLASNKENPGVVTLPSGLQYQVITEGTGPKPAATDRIRCHYTGMLIDGTVFESSYKNNQPLVIGVNQVISGWTEALQLMPTGSKWKLFIPSHLAYGDRDNGSIAAGSTLIFEIELLGIAN